MLKKIVYICAAIASGVVAWFFLKNHRHQSQSIESDTSYSTLHEWNASLQREIVRSHRDARDVCIAVITFDTKKHHGDSKEYELAQRNLIHGVRASDLIALNAEGEFYLLFPESGLDEGYEAIERLQEILPTGISISAGIAVWDHNETAAELVSRGIKSMQNEKKTPKAKIAVAETPEAIPHG